MNGKRGEGKGSGAGSVGICWGRLTSGARRLDPQILPRRQNPAASFFQRNLVLHHREKALCGDPGELGHGLESSCPQQAGTPSVQTHRGRHARDDLPSAIVLQPGVRNPHDVRLGLARLADPLSCCGIVHHDRTADVTNRFPTQLVLQGIPRVLMPLQPSAQLTLTDRSRLSAVRKTGRGQLSALGVDGAARRPRGQPAPRCGQCQDGAARWRPAGTESRVTPPDQPGRGSARGGPERVQTAAHR